MKIKFYHYWDLPENKHYELHLDREAYEICLKALNKAAHDEYMMWGVTAMNWSLEVDMIRVVEAMSMMKKSNEALEDLKKEGMSEDTPRKELKLEDIITQVENLSRKYGKS